MKEEVDPSLRYPNVKSERMLQLEEYEAYGWGSVPQRLIPRNWREILPPAMYLQGLDEDDLPERIDRMSERVLDGKRKAS